MTDLLAPGLAARETMYLWDHQKGGSVYMDSDGDTGNTRLPLLSRMHGSTGESGSPAWEALDSGQSISLYPMADLDVVDRKSLSSVFTATSSITRTLLSSVVTAGLIFLPKPSLPEHEGLATAVEMIREQPTLPHEENVVPVVAEDLPMVLRELRLQAGLPVGDLAGMLGVKRRQFYNWLNEENSPDPGSETRVRFVADLVNQLHAQLESAKQVRAALLTPVSGRTAYGLISDGHLQAAQAQLESLDSGSLSPRSLGATKKNTSSSMLLQLEHLRHSLPGEDG